MNDERLLKIKMILLQFRDLQVNKICFPCGVAVFILGQGVFTSSTTVYRVNHW